MELLDEQARRPLIALIDDYDQSFYSRNIKSFTELHVSDNGLVFFDNHPGCDAETLQAHQENVARFFEEGTIGALRRENVRVFVSGSMACITATLRYSSQPVPGVRTTYVLEQENESWKIRHMHHSFDPNESVSAHPHP